MTAGIASCIAVPGSSAGGGVGATVSAGIGNGGAEAAGNSVSVVGSVVAAGACDGGAAVSIATAPPSMIDAARHDATTVEETPNQSRVC